MHKEQGQNIVIEKEGNSQPADSNYVRIIGDVDWKGDLEDAQFINKEKLKFSVRFNDNSIVCSVIGKMARELNEELEEGQHVKVIGSISVNRWRTDEGRKIKTTHVHPFRTEVYR